VSPPIGFLTAILFFFPCLPFELSGAPWFFVLQLFFFTLEANFLKSLSGAGLRFLRLFGDRLTACSPEVIFFDRPHSEDLFF